MPARTLQPGPVPSRRGLIMRWRRGALYVDPESVAVMAKRTIRAHAIKLARKGGYRSLPAALRALDAGKLVGTILGAELTMIRSMISI